jgi:uncharacterized damage-inducible protein DinB
MITPDYIRTMAEYNAEMNRRLYGAAARLSDPERRQPRDAFWGSIHGTLTYILWGDQQWMSRFDAWPRPSTPIKQSAGMIEDFAVLRAEREKADAGVSRWANVICRHLRMLAPFLGPTWRDRPAKYALRCRVPQPW